MKLQRNATIIASVLLICVSTALADPPGSFPCPRLSGNGVQTLVASTAQAGKIVAFMRHTKAPTCVESKSVTDECGQPDRHLTYKGVVEAQQLASLMSKLGIRVEQVLASTACRTMETAAVVFGDDTVVGDSWLRDNECELENRTDFVIGKYSCSNLILVTHSTCIERILGVDVNDPIHHGITVFFNVDDLSIPIACAWPSDDDKLLSKTELE